MIRFESDCVCAVYINGSFITSGTGRTPERVNCHQVTSLLKNGENTIEMVHGGHYFQHFAIETRKQRGYWFNQAALELEIMFSRKNPAMLIAPGGGYQAVSLSREGEPIALKYLGEGFSCFVLDYSVQPEHYPQQLIEIAAAIYYIRQNAEEWSIDADKIAVNGYSAGGHLAASLGVLWNDPYVLDALKVSPENIRPDALVLGYPVISADEAISHRGSIENVSGTTDASSGLFKKMSLEQYVNARTPDTFIWHTADDALVNVKNSLVFATALAANKVRFELHVYPNGPHGLATSDYATNVFTQKHYTASWVDESVKFLFDMWYKAK